MPIATATIQPQKQKKRAGRRSKDEVDAQAQEMLEFIKSKGKDGATGREINAKFGKVVGTTKDFIQTRTRAKLKTTGAKAGMRYMAV